MAVAVAVAAAAYRQAELAAAVPAPRPHAAVVVEDERVPAAGRQARRRRLMTMGVVGGATGKARAVGRGAQDAGTGGSSLVVAGSRDLRHR